MAEFLQVFAMGSPFRVEPVSILDRNVDSTSTFLVLVGVFAMGSPCQVDFVSGLDQNEDFAHLPLRSRCVRLRSSDCYRSRLGRPCSWGDRSRRNRVLRTLPVVSSACAFPCSSGGRGDRLRSHGHTHTHPPPCRSRVCSRSRGRLPSFSARLRSEWTG